MPRKKNDTVPADLKTADYRYTNEKRTNIPPAKIASEGRVPSVPRARYYYSPHLPPVLRFDPTGEADAIAQLADAATKRPLTAAEAEKLRAALRVSEPTLEWAAKREQHEKGFFEVDPVALHIHERVSARAIIRSAMREDVQRDMFADPQQPYQEAVQFYKHDVDWANRLILGDSLQVMSSLARRENLAGRVQMIYMDPPYGIKFGTNFQNEIGKRSVEEKESDLTREPEMVKAYRDTWTLGVHSYLGYLRDRLMLCRELLTESGSIFVQISDENFHRVRAVMDEVFGAENWCRTISVTKTQGQSSSLPASVDDYLLWYARNKSTMKVRRVWVERDPFENPAERYICVETPEGRVIDLSVKQKLHQLPIPNGRILKLNDFSSQTGGESSRFPIEYAGRRFLPPGNRGWSTSVEGVRRMQTADRLHVVGNSLMWKSYRDEFPFREINTHWNDAKLTGFGDERVYIVQTASRVVERCLHLTTDPGDLVLDPTCGSGTTAVAAEKWGRRWITVDTSRVAIGIARQRVLTASFEQYRLRGASATKDSDPSVGFVYRSVPRVGVKHIAQSPTLDEVVAQHQVTIHERLIELNAALSRVTPATRARLRSKLAAKEKDGGKRAITDADRRRWLLPEGAWMQWEVPFDSDDDWPSDLRVALNHYLAVRRAKLDAVNAAIAANAEQEALVDQPEIVKGVVRVSGPFTVEGVRPEELSVGEEGLFDGTPNKFQEDQNDDSAEIAAQQNLQAYLARMVQYIRQDGLTFLGNNHRRFARVEPLFESGTGAVLHAEGEWQDATTDGEPNVAIGFGPQYGPVTAQQVEELIRASRRYDELVIAGFSFDAEATAVIHENPHPKLRIHQAYIRPDVNPGMEGLLKETPNSQLFTVFGTPEIEVKKTEDGAWTVRLAGVDVYDPVANTIRSTGADKVAAWFIDSDFDGRCFCITQAFFPDEDAWEKIVKALGSSADAEAFKAFAHSESLPFPMGRHKRVAVKVIDPRGNEVMAVRALEA